MADAWPDGQDQDATEVNITFNSQSKKKNKFDFILQFIELFISIL